MLTTVALGCIIILATALVMVFGQQSYNRNWQQANLQRDTANTMLRIKQAVRVATSTQLSTDQKTITITRPTGWIKFRYVPGQKNLNYQIQGQEEQTLLSGTVTNATFAIDASNNNKTVTVSLQLTQGVCTTSMSSTTLMRNYGS